MKTSMLIAAVMSALVTALPTSTTTPASLEPMEIRARSPPKTLPVQSHQAIELRASTPQEIRNDGRAATIFKGTNLAGQSTFVPANNYCTDISNIFGGFDGQVRSLSVEKGCKCDFYKEAGCGVNDFTGRGAVLEVGFRKKKDVRRQLGSWAGKVKSVYCQRL